MTKQQDLVFQIQRVYLKEASLEQPNSPDIFLEKEQPVMDIQLEVQPRVLADGMFEVAVCATVHTKIKERTLFLVEVIEAGIFEIRNVEAGRLEQITRITCPQIVYPYLRANVADIVQRAGFAPVHLTEVNFQAMYEEQNSQRRALSNGAAAAD